ncbi:hypothetical protein LTR66_002370 [Elasticomyces elasticus]|nr:hypothetical protein LTR66_002370 [Elasticomyces elasticus]
MVSFWPFKAEDTSAASFEKVLSALSAKINKTSAKNDTLRQHQRRYKVLWTLYSTFAYILSALILTLVTGYQNWGPVEYSALAASPLLIYGVRTSIDAYYNYRLSGSQAHLTDLIKQRDAAIDKLKTATKYNTTQSLLEKYGGAPPPKPSPQLNGKRRSASGQNLPGTPQPPRTNIPPPPTANIPGRQLQRIPSAVNSPPGTPVSFSNLTQALPNSLEPTAEFAPNAFTSQPRPAPPRQPSYTTHGSGLSRPRWYDRILDVILGEDETQPKNRIALICQNPDCRLVNGQAAPGTKSLEELGRWRCNGCGAFNGTESEEKKMIGALQNKEMVEVVGRSKENRGRVEPATAKELDEVTLGESSSDEVSIGGLHASSVDGDTADNVKNMASTDAPPSASTRSKAARGAKRRAGQPRV